MGLATAKLLATLGAIISLAGINEQALGLAIRSLSKSNKHLFAVADGRDSKSLSEWIQSTLKLGKLESAVNTAGVITPAASFTEDIDESWKFTTTVNTHGIFSCLRAQLNAMKTGVGGIGTFSRPLILTFSYT